MKPNKNSLTLVAIAIALLMGVLIYLGQNNGKKPRNQEIIGNGPQPFTEEEFRKWQEDTKKKMGYLTLDEALKTITADEIKGYVEKLADVKWEGRMSGKNGNKEAFEWIKGFHDKNGMPTMYDKFPISRENAGPKKETGDDFTQNLYTWIEGTWNKDEIVVVGAHGDHIGYGPSYSRSNKIAIHPGADDNASGTAAVMEIAQAFKKMARPLRTVVFQHYSAEEMGLIGSRYYCNNPKFPKDKPDIKSHIFMLNFDMIGFLGEGQYNVSFYSADSSPDVGAFIKTLNSKYAFADRITSRGSGGSDHASFYNKKIPIAFLHTGLHKYYHTPEDTPDRLNYVGIEKVARYACELVYLVANSENKPKFNVASFKEMEYTHDHGHPGVPFHQHSAPNINYHDYK